MTPQQRRRAELEREWEVVKRQVLERDNYICLTCGAEAQTVNHLIGRKYKNFFNDPRYLISSCFNCNRSDVADTIQARQERIEILQNEYGYDYSDVPDRRYLESPRIRHGEFRGDHQELERETDVSQSRSGLGRRRGANL